MNAVTKDVAPASAKRVSLVAKMAARYSVDPDKLMSTLKGTVFKGQKQKDGSVVEATNEQLMALLIVADQYGLNPFTKEIYAFPDKKNGIIPVVGVDGWLRIINQHPEFRGIEFRDAEDLVTHANGEHPPAPAWIEATIHRADRTIPITVREYFAECYRAPFKGKDYTVDGPWQTHPSRFLRHKAVIQAGRVAFGFVGIYDPDEAERIRDAIDVTPTTTITTKPATKAPREKAAPATPQLEAKPRDALLADLQLVLDATGVPEKAICEQFKVGHVEELDDAGLATAAQWARDVQ